MIDRHLFQLAGASAMAKRLAVLEVLQAFLIIGQALSLSGVLTRLWQGDSLNWLWLALFALCFLLRQLSTWLRGNWLDHYSAKAAEQLRRRLLTKIFSAGQALVQRQGTGSLVTLSLDGIDQVRQYIKLVFSKVLTMMIVPVLLFVGMLFLNWPSALILLLMYPLIVLFMIILGFAAQARAIKQFGNFQKLSNNFLDSLRGIDTLKYLGLSKRYSKGILRLSENFRHKTMAVLRVAMLSTFALDFFTTLSIAIIAVYLGFGLLNGQIQLFPALAILILAPEYFMPIRDFAGDFHATLNGKNAFARIRTLLQTKQAPPAQLRLQAWEPQSQLELKNVRFNYPHGAQIGSLSLRLQGNLKVGIMGMSGSGKTTLINLLSGFLTPTSGQIIIQGQPVHSLKLPTWQRQLLYIPQNPYIFTASLRANVAFYTPEASDALIKKAIHVVGLDDLLASLPAGLDTVIGQGRRLLSGGQAQRIALARAFLDHKRRVLVFDEPTAHLDLETEMDLKQRMLPLMQGKLVFFASHRLHWMKEMDYLLVMHHGQLVEQGTYAALQKQGGYFMRLIQEMRGGQNA